MWEDFSPKYIELIDSFFDHYFVYLDYYSTSLYNYNSRPIA